MESPIAIYQLIILYMLNRSGGEIAVPHLSAFLIENGYVNFESLVSTYEEARNNGYVESLTRGDKTFLRLTPEGRTTWKLFRKDLSPAIQQQADEYLTRIGRQLVSDRAIVGEYYKASYGGFMVHMAVKEDQAILLELNLNVPSEESAKKVLLNWQQHNSDIYQQLVGQLFR